MENMAIRLLVVAGSISFSTIASSSDLETMRVATNLANVIASEKFCGLNYDQAAISAFIEANVPADNMKFPTTLGVMISGAEFSQKDMSKSAKTAHCTQIQRIAKSYGLSQ